MLAVHAGADEFGGLPVSFPAAEHLTIAGAGYGVPVADPFLNDPRVDPDPAHVTFSRVDGIGVGGEAGEETAV